MQRDKIRVRERLICEGKTITKHLDRKEIFRINIYYLCIYLLFVDSQSVIHLGKNSTFHSRSKHIDVKYHWIRDALDAKLLELAKIHTDDNGAELLGNSWGVNTGEIYINEP